MNAIKADIVAVGLVSGHLAWFWKFDIVPDLTPLYSRRDDGALLIAGYTVDELRRISAEHYGGARGIG